MVSQSTSIFYNFNSTKNHTKYNYSKVPDDMKRKHRWVLWKLTPPKHPGDHAGKIPINVKTGKRASVIDPKTWTDFKTAKRMRKKFNANGLGFVLGDGYCCLDIDDIERTLAEQIIDPGRRGNMLAEIDQLCRHSYTEVSQSGQGTHTFIKGNKTPGTPCRKGHFELYSKSRYIAMTDVLLYPRRDQKVQTLSDAEMTKLEDRTTGSKVITNNQKSIRQPAKISKTKSKDDIGNDLTIDELLEKVKTRGQFRSDVMHGDYSGYLKPNGQPDHSVIDMAVTISLAFWSNRDARKVDQAFRRTSFMRRKWDERHYSNGMTYGQHTIMVAIQKLNEMGRKGYRFIRKKASHDNAKESK